MKDTYSNYSSFEGRGIEKNCGRGELGYDTL
jgi:hypothetical protein